MPCVIPFKLIKSSSTPNSFNFKATASFSFSRVSFDLLISSFAVSSSIASILEILSGVVCAISSIELNPSETNSCPNVSSTSRFLIRVSVLSLNSACLLSESSLSVRISISKLVSLEASLTF